METKPTTQEQNKNIGTSGSTSGSATSQAYSAAEQKGSEIKDQIINKSSEMVDSAKQTATEAYEKTNQALTENYQKAMDYGRENPATMALIALGAGIGIGLLLSNTYSSRSRASRLVPPVMDALTTLAYDIFKR